MAKQQGSAHTAAEVEMIFLGTGTSGGVPTIGCLTDPKKGCYCCRSTLEPAGHRNVRRNTSAVLRYSDPELPDRKRTLLIDAGKTFYEGAKVHWPAKQLREIDSVLLTHPHSDAILGLDDLRGWTLGAHIQSSITIYCSRYTYDEISKAFPYLTDASKATGGGDVPLFQWVVWDKDDELDIHGLKVTPLAVHHGVFFHPEESPYICHGFLLRSPSTTVAYISDVSHIPPETTDVLKKQKIDLLVIDCLRVTPHKSHFGLSEALLAIQTLTPTRTYLVGFAHGTTHEALTVLCDRLTRAQLAAPAVSPRDPDTFVRWELVTGCEDPSQAEDTEKWMANVSEYLAAKGALPEKDGHWVRPAHDGLSVFLREGGDIDDDDLQQ